MSGTLPAIGSTILYFFPSRSFSSSYTVIFFELRIYIHTHTRAITFRSIMAAPQKSVGQGNLHSPLNLRPVGSSIVQRLSTRSIAGRELGVNVHQHYGWRLHLEWQTENGRSHCFERFFTFFEDVDLVCRELMRGGATGLSDCVSNDLLDFTWVCDCGEARCRSSFIRFLKGKVNVCSIGPIAQSHSDLIHRQEVPRSWLRQCQEMDPDRYKCLCSVTSSEWVYSDKEWTTVYSSLPSSPTLSFSTSSSSSSSQNDV